MTSYICAKKGAPHKFCPICGSALLIDIAGSDIGTLRGKTAINVSSKFELLRINVVTFGRRSGCFRTLRTS